MPEFLMGPVSPKSQSDYCMFDTRLTYDHTSRYLSDPWPLYSCKLESEHEGDHNANVTWIGHLYTEMTRNTYVPSSLKLQVRTRDSGYGTAYFKSLEQTQEFCDWLLAQAEEVFDEEAGR